MHPLRKTARRFLKILERELPYYPAIPFLGIYLKKKTKTLIQKDTGTPDVHSSIIYICQNMETT